MGLIIGKRTPIRATSSPIPLGHRLPVFVCGRWGLSIDGEVGLHAGEPVDVLIAGPWVSGRVEYSHGSEKPGYVGWYICGGGRGWCPLAPGMVARRVDQQPAGEDGGGLEPAPWNGEAVAWTRN